MKLVRTLTIAFGEHPEYDYYVYALSGLERRCLDGDDDFLYFICTVELDKEEDCSLIKTPLDNVNRMYTFAKYNMGKFETSMDLCHAWAVEHTALSLLAQHNIIYDRDPNQLRMNFEDIKSTTMNENNGWNIKVEKMPEVDLADLMGSKESHPLAKPDSVIESSNQLHRDHLRFSDPMYGDTSGQVYG